MSFFEANDPIFRSYVGRNAPVKPIASGFDWTEGPVWFGDAGCLLFSRHPEQPDYALDAARWRVGVPRAVEPCERTYPACKATMNAS